MAGLRLLSEREEAAAAEMAGPGTEPGSAPPAESAAAILINIASVALRVLSDRIILLLVLAAMMGAYLWMPEQPTNQHLIALGIFAAFALLLVLMTRKK